MLKQFIIIIFRLWIILFIWFIIWELISYFQLISPMLLPAPHKIISNMIRLDFLAGFVSNNLPITFFWVLIAWVIGIISSSIFALVSLHSVSITAFFNVIFIAGRALPSVIAIPLFAAIMGFDRLTTFVCATFLVVCYSEPSIQESLRSINTTRKALLETVPLSKVHSFILIILPGIAKTLRAISTQSFGIALVVTIAGEMILALSNSVGNEVAQMAWLLRMVDLYSMIGWLISCALITMYITEFLPKFFEIPAYYTIKKLNLKIL